MRCIVVHDNHDIALLSIIVCLLANTMNIALQYVGYTVALLVTLYSIVMTLYQKNHLFHESAVFSSIGKTSAGMVPVSFRIIDQPFVKSFVITL